MCYVYLKIYMQVYIKYVDVFKYFDILGYIP